MKTAHLGLMAAFAILAVSHPAAAKAAKADCRATDLAGLAGWSGVWIGEHMETAINGRDELGVAPGAPPNPAALGIYGVNAPWNDEGWSRFEKVMRTVSKAEFKQSGWGFPVMMASASPFKFVISPRETVITSQYREIRYVYTDGRGHPAEEDRWPTVWGDSIGCWKGRTLVVDTVDAKYSPDFNAVAPPVSDQARFVEKMRLVAPGRIESEITVTDPVTLQKPWVVKLAFIHPKGIDRLVHDGNIFDNDRSVTDVGTGSIVQAGQRAAQPESLPPDAKLTEAELDRFGGTYAFDGPPFTLKVERRGPKLFMEVLPVQPFWTPLHPRSPTDFEFAGSALHFTADAAGAITGFTGKQPDGMPIAGKRVAARP